MVYTNKFIHFCQCQWKWWIFTELRSSEVNIHQVRSVTKIVTYTKKVVLLQCINNQISQWRLAVSNVKKATSIKGLVHKFRAYCSHASKCLQLRHGALYKASRHHHDDIYMMTETKMGWYIHDIFCQANNCSWYELWVFIKVVFHWPLYCVSSESV